MNPVHTWILLDRSGSMASIADDVVGGFNEFLDRQRQLEGEARVTLAQFDNEDPSEVRIDGVSLRELTGLSLLTHSAPSPVGHSKALSGLEPLWFWGSLTPGGAERR